MNNRKNSAMKREWENQILSFDCMKFKKYILSQKHDNNFSNYVKRCLKYNAGDITSLQKKYYEDLWYESGSIYHHIDKHTVKVLDVDKLSIYDLEQYNFTPTNEARIRLAKFFVRKTLRHLNVLIQSCGKLACPGCDGWEFENDLLYNFCLYDTVPYGYHTINGVRV